MNRPLLTILVPLAFASLASGCTTFSDNDAIARIGETELSEAKLAELSATELQRLVAEGTATAEQELTADQTRQVIGSWIGTTATDAGLISAERLAGLGEAELAPVYARGLADAGISCLNIIVTPTIADADSAAERIAAGETFADVFNELNVDPTLVETVGDVGCIPQAELPPIEQAPPIVVAVYGVNARNRIGTAEAENQDGTTNGLLVAFREFDQLNDTDADLVLQTARDVAGVGLLIQDIDIQVDPRYGMFDPATGGVIPLG